MSFNKNVRLVYLSLLLLQHYRNKQVGRTVKTHWFVKPNLL